MKGDDRRESLAAARTVQEASSFRDPAGYLFWRNGEIYRCVRQAYIAQFEATRASGLLEQCIRDGLLLPFEEGFAAPDGETDCCAVLKPQQLEQISYPYEWSFEQLKDAALLTLDLHLRALEKDMVLKDASAFNVQFIGARPWFIDHLSFAALDEYGMWPAYGQFCRHFLAPLALMSRIDPGLGRLLQVYLDGIPLPLAAKLLGRKSWLSPGLLLHLVLHARLVAKHGGEEKKVNLRRLSAGQLKGIAQGLRSLVAKLKPTVGNTEWANYYEQTNYSAAAFAAKKALVRELVALSGARRVWDLGGNDGTFSRAISDLVESVVCMDLDPIAVGRNYELCKRENIANILPIVLDLGNPTPAVGFANEERSAFFKRSRPDCIVALAVIHHLRISANVPLKLIAQQLAAQSSCLIIEFIPKEDSQVRKLFLNRKDEFDDYYQSSFEAIFSQWFAIEQSRPIPESQRRLYIMRRRT